MGRDYAHKPRGPEGPSVPRWVWLFTAVVAVGFVGFLYYLSDVPEDSQGADIVRQQLSEVLNDTRDSAVDDSETQQSEPRETLQDLQERAEALKQSFEFYTLLEEDAVVIDLPEPTERSDASSQASDSGTAVNNADDASSSWIIQVASFASVSDADSVRAELILNGLPSANIVSVDVNGATYHRVMVGPYDHRPTLNKAQDILAELNYEPLVKSQ